eukprot:CAMPEP_0167792020 /NCGR_PEP_ID=MMETSP0111_2-20121227/12313_1 /TAXON_ID=91324 /ORGANISM="Lotharella globosa, Strain CCCM811" /LENGTH=64 /DNA_ID=CAMNT_0007684861 /DNA_START=148 /DNA_END=342 /DNA_ORIENTATION=-
MKGDKSAAATSCYIAAAIYIVFLGLSGICLYKAKKNKELEEAAAAAKLKQEEQEENQDVKLPNE